MYAWSWFSGKIRGRDRRMARLESGTSRQPDSIAMIMVTVMAVVMVMPRIAIGTGGRVISISPTKTEPAPGATRNFRFGRLRQQAHGAGDAEDQNSLHGMFLTRKAPAQENHHAGRPAGAWSRALRPV